MAGRPSPQTSFPGHFLSRLRLFVLQCGLRCVHGKRVVHPIEVKVFFDHVSHQSTFFALVNFLGRWVLPLETRCLLCRRFRLLLDRLEHAGAELRAQGSKSALLFQGLNDQVFQIVHFFSRRILSLVFFLFKYINNRDFNS